MGWGWDDLLGIPTGGAYTAYKHMYKEPADAKKAGLDQLSEELHGLADENKAFQMEGLGKALDMYKRPNAINQQLYGDPASLSVAKYTGR